jgi:hypothetical protein
MSTRPALGEVVHYVSQVDATCQAAMVVGFATDERLHLQVFTLPGMRSETNVPYAHAENSVYGTWHWGCGRS